MRSKFKWIFTLLVALTMQFSFAQEKTVTGVVSDKTGPLPGANVVVKGTKRGAQTDFDGKFSIQAKQGEVLVISFVGMQDATVTVGAANTVNIKLEDGVQLSEVVIQTNLGYFKKDANKITSGLSVVNADDLKKQVPSSSLENALQGKAAGVQVSALNGQPGQRAYVSVRGAINVTGGNANAAYVVDGAFVRASEMPALGPNDIETMTVLKDGAAAALYGIKGGNGVIVITTKKGKNNQKTKFEISNSVGGQEAIKDKFKLMNTNQKIAYENALQEGPTFGLSDAELDVLRSFDHNWRDDLLKKGALHNFNFSMTGGNESMSHFLSVGYNKNEGIIQGLDGYSRITARYNSDFTANKWLKGGFSVGGAYEKTQFSRDRNNVQNPFRAMYDYNPYEPLYERDLTTGELILDENGNPSFNPTQQGLSISEAILNNTSENRSFRGFVRPNLEVTLYKGLTFGTRFSMNYERIQGERFTKPGSQLDLILNAGVPTGRKTDLGSDNLDYQWTNTLTYNFNVKENHHFNAILLQEYFKQNFRSYSASRDGFAPGIDVGDGATPVLATSAHQELGFISYFANVDYDYKDKYLLSLYGRRDGSSQAGQDVKWRNAKGASIGWNVTKEDFFKVKYVDLLKFRASYGELNSLNNIGFYDAQQTYGSDSYGGLNATTIDAIGNPSLGFEQAKKLDLGVDLELFKSRIVIAASYFMDKRDDFIYIGQTTNGTGFQTFTNIGSYTIKGGELELKGFAVKNKNTSLAFYVNAAKFDRIIDKLDNPDDPDNRIDRGFTANQVGYAPDTFVLVPFAGIDPTNGHALYYDQDGNKTDVFTEDNQRLIKGKTPYAKYEGGFGAEFSWKGFDLSADFVFKAGNYSLNLRQFNSFSDGGNATSNQAVGAANYWTPTNTTSDIPVPNQILALNGETDANGDAIDSNQFSTRFLEDASYIRFRNLSFGYSFDKSVLKDLPLEKVRVYCQLQNLHTWTKFLGDPEVGIGNNEDADGNSTTNSLVVGQFQGYSYPTVKSYVFGITVNF